MVYGLRRRRGGGRTKETPPREENHIRIHRARPEAGTGAGRKEAEGLSPRGFITVMYHCVRLTFLSNRTVRAYARPHVLLRPTAPRHFTFIEPRTDGSLQYLPDGRTRRRLVLDYRLTLLQRGASQA